LVNAITENDLMKFDMTDITDLRKEMGELLDNLSAVYLSMKKTGKEDSTDDEAEIIERGSAEGIKNIKAGDSMAIIKVEGNREENLQSTDDEPEIIAEGSAERRKMIKASDRMTIIKDEGNRDEDLQVSANVG
jgi:hypothetical protein